MLSNGETVCNREDRLLAAARLGQVSRCNYSFPIKLAIILIVLLQQQHQQSSIQTVEASSAMKRLYEDLFTDYNRLILPVANNKTKVIVTLGLKLGQILDLNLKQQILSTNVWVEQTWHDYKLQWAPEEYEGIDMIHVPAESIWIPDIVLFNNADGNYELTLVAKARLYSNGTVVWKPPTMFRSTCEIDVEYFPFDIQTCFLRFGSWTYAGDEVEIRHPANQRKAEIGIDLSQFYKNVEWDIIDVPAYYNENYYDCCSEPFPDITFKIVIRRKMLFYLVNLILPVALMTFMTVSVFYLPSDSNEKVTLSISILTSLIVFFLLMLEIIPASSLAVPLFGKYLLFTLVLVSLSACVSVYVLNIHHRSPAVHPMSPRVRNIFLKVLPRLMRLNRPDPRERSSLNRFRKKKIAQQILEASTWNSNNNNKVYDLAQPFAAGLNLIETLHRSYEFNRKDDSGGKSQDDDDDEGRYFRRYVDNYINQLKRAPQEKDAGQSRLINGCANMTARQYSSARENCCEHFKCCSLGQNNRFKQMSTGPGKPANSSLEDASSCNRCSHPPASTMTRSRPDYGGDQVPGGNYGRAGHLSRSGMLNDDTLDMATFDYDEQPMNLNIGGQQQQLIPPPPPLFPPLPMNQTSVDGLPTPPPPPRQLARLNDSMQSGGRVSSCSKTQLEESSDESLRNLRANEDEAEDDADTEADNEQGQQLVHRLINSINIINNASDELDTTTTLSNNDCADAEEEDEEDAGGQLNGRQFAQEDPIQNSVIYQHSKLATDQYDHRQQHLRPMASATGCICGQTNQRQPAESSASSKLAAKLNQIKQPSDLLMSLRLSYDQMPAHVRAAIRSILFIADTIKNEDDENSAIEDWESVSMVVDRLFLWIFFLLCTFGSIIILALAPSLYDQRASIDDKLRIDIPPSNCSASVHAH